MRALPLILAALLLGAPLLAGCLGPADAHPHGRMARVGNATEVACEHRAAIRWSDPALFGRLWALEPPSEGRVSVRRWSPPALLAFDAPEVPEAWREGTLVGVWWRVGERDVVTLEAHEDGTSHVGMHPALDPQARRERVSEFLDALGLGDHPRHDEWMQALDAWERSGPRMLSLGDARPDLDALRARLASQGEPVVESPGGGGILRWGAWELRFALPHVYVEAVDVSLMAERGGLVTAYASTSPYADEGPAVRARVDALLARLGLPEAQHARATVLDGGSLRC